MWNASKCMAKIGKNGSEIFNLKTPRCNISLNIAQITFRVFEIDFWAQFTPKIKLGFSILGLPPPLDIHGQVL
jgi:hypothetical protein